MERSNNESLRLLMKRDKTHKEQIERWAEYVKENPHTWKPRFKEFIDSQIIMSRRFYNKLAETYGGKEKIKLLRNLANKNLKISS